MDFEQLIMDCFDHIYLSTSNLFDTNINVLTDFMISIFIAAPAARV